MQESDPPRNDGPEVSPVDPPPVDTKLSEIKPDEIPAELVGELESLPDNVRPTLTRIFSRFSFSGILPAPTHYGQYDAILPGTANRLLIIAEQDAAHRREVEMLIVKGQVADGQAERDERWRGQIYGLTIGVVTVIAGAITALYDQPWAGGFIGTSGVAGLVSVFVLGRHGAATTSTTPEPADEGSDAN